MLIKRLQSSESLSDLKSSLQNLSFAKNSFLKKSFAFVSISAVSQLIPILTAPILTRIYTPENYGLLGLFMTVSSILGLFATMQFQFAIVKEKDEYEAFNLFQLCLVLAILMSVLSAFLMYALGGWITEYFKAEQLQKWLVLIPIATLISGWNNSMLSWTNRKAQFRTMSVVRIITALFVPAISITFGVFSQNESGLFLGFLGGQLITFALLVWFVFRHESQKLHFNIDRLKISWRNHVDFPRYNLPSEFLNLVVAQFPIFFLGRYFGLATVGQFSLSNRILNMPSLLISQSVGEIFRQRASSEYNETGKCDRFFIKTFVGLFIIGLLPFGLVVVFGGELFRIAFGTAWSEAGMFAQVLTPMFFLRFVISPLTFVTFLAGKHHIGLVGSAVYGATTVAACYIASLYTSSVYNILLVYVVNFAFIYTVMLFLNYKFSKGPREIPT